jgi:hypothetical protein
MSYIPTDSDRCHAATVYHNENRTSFEPVLSASDYIANGATVTLKDGGLTCWVVTVSEAREIGICFESFNTVCVKGRKWVVTLS